MYIEYEKLKPLMPDEQALGTVGIKSVFDVTGHDCCWILKITGARDSYFDEVCNVSPPERIFMFLSYISWVWRMAEMRGETRDLRRTAKKNKQECNMLIASEIKRQMGSV